MRLVFSMRTTCKLPSRISKYSSHNAHPHVQHLILVQSQPTKHSHRHLSCFQIFLYWTKNSSNGPILTLPVFKNYVLLTYVGGRIKGMGPRGRLGKGWGPAVCKMRLFPYSKGPGVIRIFASKATTPRKDVYIFWIEKIHLEYFRKVTVYLEPFFRKSVLRPKKLKMAI
jgi:hypothetical protein